MDFVNFSAELVELEELEGSGGARARIVPYNTPAPYGTGTVKFARGGLTLPSDPVPVTIDHGTGVLDRIGVLDEFEELDDGAYGTLRFSDVPAAATVRTLLRDRAVTDVSIGVALPETHGSGDARTMTGQLDHVSIVPRGRFRGEDGAGARVLAVHDERPEEVAPMTDTLTTDPASFEAAADELRAEFRSTLSAELAEFGATLDELREALLANPPAVSEHAWQQQLDAGVFRAMGLPELAEHAIADVVGDLGAADASPLAPDFYWAGGLQQNIDRRRPLFTMSGSGEFPAYGNDLVSARVTQEVTVGSAAEKAEPSSQALQLSAITFPIVAHKGVVDVSMELMKRSNPNVMRVLRDSYMRAYAVATNADLATKVEAAGTHTGAVLTTGTYAGFVADVVTQSNAIEDATGLPGDRLAVTGAQWIAILTLADGNDRRQFAEAGDDAYDGRSLLTARAINIGGVWVYRDYSVSHAIQHNALSIVTAEDAPEVMADRNLGAMGYDVGLFGQTVAELWPAGIYEYAV